MNVKHFILSTARLLGLFTLSRWLTASRIRILAYHGIWLGEGHFGNFLYMSASKFERRMGLLESLGYPVASLTEALEKRKAGRLPKGTTVITIDDGWYSTSIHMLPVLKKHGYPATVYLTTHYCFNQAPVIDVALQYCIHQIDPGRHTQVHIPEYDVGPLRITSDADKNNALIVLSERAANLGSDTDKQLLLQSVCHHTAVDYGLLSSERWFHLMTPREVEAAADQGFAVELHTHHHRITYKNEDCLKEEVALNREKIEVLTGQIPVHFCYPSGKFSTAAWPTLKDEGIASATTTQIGLVDDQSAVYALPRILDGQNISELEFEAEMSGFMELLRQARIFFKRPAEELG